MPDIARRAFLAQAGVAVAGLAAISTVGKAIAETVDPNPSTRSHTMKRYVIEREIPGIGASNEDQCSMIAATSNSALAQLAPHVQWEHSYFTADKTFCVYLADSEEAIRKHAEISGFPANKITLVTGIVDPTTAKA